MRFFISLAAKSALENHRYCTEPRVCKGRLAEFIRFYSTAEDIKKYGK